VANRSQSLRVAWASSAIAACAVFGVTLLSGCQSAGQYDQVARELRMQEDELYAMEDYLEQYQQLVCKYRSENARLKRQLAESGVTPATERPERGPRPTRSVPPADETPPADDTPPTNIQPPEVPPLGETTDDGAILKRRHRAHGDVMQVAAEMTEDESKAARTMALEAADQSKPASDVWLHGEVVVNDEGGGPRMVVEVQPLDAEAKPTLFDGALSLLLTAPGDQGETVNVARWDYRPNDVRAAIDATSEDKPIRFHVELPPDTVASEASEIWVRLLPRGGGKLLTRTAIDLLEPSKFSSHEGMESADRLVDVADVDDEGIATASVYSELRDEANLSDESADVAITPTSAEMFDGGWTIATPGRPAGLVTEASKAKSDWKASLEPPPTAMATSVASRPRPPRVHRSASEREARGTRPAASSTKAAGWSPERGGSSSATPPRSASSASSGRPGWSATR
jgi:hypothetical protein